MENLQAQIDEINKKLTYKETDNEFTEFVRDLIFPNNYINANASITTTNIGAGGGTVISPSVFDAFLEVKYRGKTYRIGVYQISQ